MTRSRNGCLSCKKLRIKCNEAKPMCEYCVATGRECLYPSPRLTKATKVILRVMAPQFYLHNASTKSINSIMKHLQINLFELKLLYLYKLSMAPFVANSNEEIQTFLMEDAPRLFVRSPMVRNAIFAFTSILLLKLPHNLSHSQPSHRNRTSTPHLSDLDLAFMEGQSLLSTTNAYFGNAIKAINEVILAKPAAYQADAVALLISALMTYVYVGLHGHELLPLVKFDEHDNYSYDYHEVINLNTDFLTVSQTMNQVFSKLAVSLRLMQYNNHWGLKSPKKNAWTTLLRATAASDPLKNVLVEAIFHLECCMNHAYMVDLFRPLYKFIIVASSKFKNLVREKHPVALSIMFLYSFLCFNSQFYLVKEKNIWYGYIQWYRDYSFRSQGLFKDHLDHILWELVPATPLAMSPREFMSADPVEIYEGARKRITEGPVAMADICSIP